LGFDFFRHSSLYDRRILWQRHLARMDILSKAILNVFAVAGFIWLALKISRPQPALPDK
jgi:hypothetical protein